MQRHWVMAILLASGLLAQAPPPATAPVQQPVTEPKPTGAKPEVPGSPQVLKPGSAETKTPEAMAFDQLRPSQRKLAYTLNRAALAAHELGYYRSHPSTIDVRDALDGLVKAKLELPEKAQTAMSAVEAYLSGLRANHGLYDAEGKKILLEVAWRDLQAAARAAAKTGRKDLEPRLKKIKSLLLDPKADATAPGWTEPEAAAKGKKTKAVKTPKVPEGFATQKAVTALWVKRALAWIENTSQETEVKGEKKTRRLPDPVQTKALNDLLAWLDRDDLDLLRDPGFGWLDLRRLGAVPGAGLLAKAGDIAASKPPEGAPAELSLMPTLEPVLAESKFGKADEKRSILAEVKQGPPPATLAAQMEAFERLAHSRELEVK
jgi:hypothetical protein